MTLFEKNLPQIDRQREREREKEKEKEKEKGKENEKGKEKEKESEGEGTTGSISLIGFARSVNVHNKQYLLGLRQV